VKAADGALEKFAAAAAAAGVTAKPARIGPDAITEEAKKSIAPYVKARGPSKAEMDFAAKRADPKASMDEVINACRAALQEAETIAGTYEKGEQFLREISATHKMSLDSQCGGLATAQTVHKEIGECGKKKSKSTECKISCGKGKTILDDGIPAAAFAGLEKDHAEFCKE
jgi:hypothetical protein